MEIVLQQPAGHLQQPGVSPDVPHLQRHDVCCASCTVASTSLCSCLKNMEAVSVPLATAEACGSFEVAVWG